MLRAIVFDSFPVNLFFNISGADIVLAAVTQE